MVISLTSFQIHLLNKIKYNVTVSHIWQSVFVVGLALQCQPDVELCRSKCILFLLWLTTTLSNVNYLEIWQCEKHVFI